MGALRLEFEEAETLDDTKVIMDSEEEAVLISEYIADRLFDKVGGCLEYDELVEALAEIIEEMI